MTGPEIVRCRGCGRPLALAEIGWNRARRCADCRALALHRHALNLDAPTDDDEEDD